MTFAKLLFPHLKDYKRKRQMRALGTGVVVGMIFAVFAAVAILYVYSSQRFWH